MELVMFHQNSLEDIEKDPILIFINKYYYYEGKCFWKIN
jgi:hypothetical protein